MSDADRALVTASTFAALAPTPRMTADEWGELHRYIPASVGLVGPYRLTDYPMLREPLYHLSAHSRATRVAVVKAAQLGWSEMALTALGYWCHLAPGPAMVVQSTQEAMKLFSTQRIGSLIRDTPVLASRVTGQSLSQIDFPGAVIKLASAEAESDLQSMPCRYIIADEVDRWPACVGRSGDPVDVVLARTTTFEGRQKVLLISTPSVTGASRIETAYLEGDRRVWEVPCPHCGTCQELEPERLRWIPDHHDRVWYECASCLRPIEESAKRAMCQAGQWRATRPDGPYPSYRISGLLRPPGHAGWRTIAAKWDAARKDPERMRAVVNLEFGRPYSDERGKVYSYGDLTLRREQYRAQCPAGVCVLTAGVDVQTGSASGLGQRVEVEVVGWGAGFESWSILHRRIMGRLDQPEVWQELERVLLATYSHEIDPRGLKIGAACIDTGGHHAQQVHEWLRPHYAASRRWHAVKGIPGEGRTVWPTKVVRSRRHNAPLWLLGVDSAKTAIYEWLAVQSPGPGYVHAPHDRDAEWFAQLTAEEVRYTTLRGRMVRTWVIPDHRRNEALDCRVYAYAGLCSLEAEGLPLQRIVDERSASVARLTGPSNIVPTQSVTPAPARKLASTQPRIATPRAGWGARR